MASRGAGRGRRRALLAMATAVALTAGVRAGWARSWWYAVRLGPIVLIVLIVLDSTRVADPAQLGWLQRTLAGAVAASIHDSMELAGYPDRLELRAVDQQGRVFDQLVETW
jgi:hypothetical protein